MARTRKSAAYLYVIPVVALVFGVAVTFFTVAACFVYAIGQTGDVHVPSLVMVTNDESGFTVQTGIGIVGIPLLFGLVGVGVAALLWRRDRARAEV